MLNEKKLRLKRLKLNGKKKSILILSIFVISLILLLQSSLNSLALQDNDDLETTISAHLDSDSTELIGGLMTLGTYDYYDTPEWDVGLFDHDLTQIQVSRIQTTNTNITNAESHVFSNGVNATEGNHSLEFNTKIPQYEISNGLDTKISVNYSYVASDWNNTILFQDTLSTSDWNVYDSEGNPELLSGDVYLGDPNITAQIGSLPVFGGSLSSDWEDASHPYTNYIDVVSEKGGHSNVFHGVDTRTGAYTYIAGRLLDPSQMTGIVEAWVMVDDA